MALIIKSLTGMMFACIPIVWIVMHYHYRHKGSSGFTEDEARQLQDLLRIADTMAERIKTLESILDAEAPEWREQHDTKN
ncbi:MAG: envelope stress response membrane protein PspB [Pseudomonadales bacterium]|jgi:phage shock protein B|nr:envelope stress response membrane protein PspB [Pseudomonadales bacterium]